MNSNIIQTIIKEEINLYLQDTILLTVLDTNIMNKHNTSIYSSTINLTKDNDINFLIVISIQQKLFDTIFNKYFKNEDITNEEKEELIKALPDEIINTVVGLSIKRLPKEDQDFTLSLPEKIDENISSILSKHKNITIKITTDMGSLGCTVIKTNC